VVIDRFEWNAQKAAKNKKKHGVSFELAEEVFEDPLNITIRDRFHSEDEYRYVIIGETLSSEILVVTYAERGDHIRIISARRPTRAEKRRYMKEDLDLINDTIDDSDDMQPEYDFSRGVRGRYSDPGKTIIRMTIDEDVARHYWSSELVNKALRQLIAEGRAPEPRDE
jgi:uncharacterized DUF497 family protein